MQHDTQSAAPERPGPARKLRPFIGVLFECCQIYQRIYRDPASDCYRGRCPRCLRVVEVQVGPQGTSERIFRAS